MQDERDEHAYKASHVPGCTTTVYLPCSQPRLDKPNTGSRHSGFTKTPRAASLRPRTAQPCCASSTLVN